MSSRNPTRKCNHGAVARRDPGPAACDHTRPPLGRRTSRARTTVWCKSITAA